MSFRYEKGERVLVPVPIADSVAVNKGDPSNLAAGTATVFTSQADNATFHGIFAEKKVANDGKTSILVDISDTSRYRCTMVSDSYVLGLAVRMDSAAQTLVDTAGVADAEMVAMVMEELPAASTEGVVTFHSRTIIDAKGA